MRLAIKPGEIAICIKEMKRFNIFNSIWESKKSHKYTILDIEENLVRLENISIGKVCILEIEVFKKHFKTLDNIRTEKLNTLLKSE